MTEKQEFFFMMQLLIDLGLALTGLRTTRPWLKQVNLDGACEPIKTQYLVSGQLKKHEL